jgi:hypothetical protein
MVLLEVSANGAPEHLLVPVAVVVAAHWTGTSS